MNKTGITTKEFILSVKNACKGKINVVSVIFSHKYNFRENGETLEATIFYSKENEDKANFSCCVYEFNEEFSLQKLLLLVNKEIDEIYCKGEKFDAVIETINKTKKKK